jgi:Flp pilus assembly protein TadG
MPCPHPNETFGPLFSNRLITLPWDSPAHAPPLGRRLRDFLCKNESGSSLVEFSLCLPPLLILVTGIFAFGITIGNYVTLINATSVGAQQVAISRSQTLDPCSTASSAVISATPSLKSSNLTFSLVLNGTTYSGTSCESNSYTTGSSANMVQGKTAQLTVTYPCNLRIYRQNSFANCTLTANTAEIIQ